MNRRFRKIYVEITNICNLSCSFCPKTERAPHFMTAKEFERVLEQSRPYTDYVYLHLMGEPLLHPQLAELLELCGKWGVKVNLTTNGTKIADVKQIILTAPALRKIGFSLHSFEANDPQRSLDLYLDPILDFLEAAKETGLYCELRLWNDDSQTRSGKNSLNAKMIRRVEQRLDVCAAGELDRRGSVKLRDRLYLGFAQVFDWPDLQREDEQGKLFCYGLRDQIGILADGTVVPCCLDSEGTIALGNIYTQPLAELLETPRARAIYAGFSRREAAEPLCRRCGYARRFT